MQAGLTAGGVLGPLVGGFLAEVFGMPVSYTHLDHLNNVNATQKLLNETLRDHLLQ